MDVRPDMGAMIRQLGKGYYDIGVERAASDVAYVEVRVDNYLLTDVSTGQQQSTRGVVRYRFTQLGTRDVEIATYSGQGERLQTIARRFSFR